MKNLLKILFFFFFPLLLNAQTTYYISSSGGSDSNGGTSENSPWKTILKLNNVNFLPGDKILFKRGDIWEDGTGLIIKNSGTQNNRITFGTYGSGDKPEITLIAEVAGWKDAANWSKARGDSVWKMTFPNFGYQASSTSKIARLWLDSKEYPKAKDLSSTNLDQLTPGERETFGVNRKHRHYHEGSNPNQLYVWTNGTNPASYYSSMEYTGYYSEKGMERFTVQLKNADYVIIENLMITGGLYSPISLNGSDNVIIRNCYIGKSQHAGVAGDMQLASDKSSDNLEVNGCTIDTERKVKVNFYDGLVEYGLMIDSDLKWKIHNNTIRNWNFGMLILAKYGESKYHEFYDNEVTAPDIEACKPIQIGGDNENFKNGWHKVYRNYFYDIGVGILVGRPGCKFYFNIIKNSTYSENEHFTQGNSGYGFILNGPNSSGGPNPGADSTYIFNNTIYNTNHYAINTGVNNVHFVFNNLFINTGLVYNYLIRPRESSKFQYSNNLFFRTSMDSSSKIIISLEGNKYTVSEFNRLHGINNLVVSGNRQHCGSLNASLINLEDFTLPGSSCALGSGIDISSYIPEGFTDRAGNNVDRSSPSIGAIQSSVSFIKVNVKVFLQAPYTSGVMQTILNGSGKVPQQQPYRALPWNYQGTESFTDAPEEIVDWILMDLRSDTSSSSVVSSRAALIRHDGSVVDVDGISAVSFPSVNQGSYYIVIRHRNHLPVMSAEKINFSGSAATLYNFTTSPTKAFGNDLADLGSGIFGMYAGDGDANGVINVLDYGSVGNNMFDINYKSGDLDLNGIINVLDFKNANINLLKTSKVPGFAIF